MEILNVQKLTHSPSGEAFSNGVFLVLAKINDSEAKEEAEALMSEIIDTSWISKIDNAITKASFLSRAQPTIEKIIRDIISNVSSEITEEFGEYLVSNSAKNVLKDGMGHNPLPLAELWGLKKSGNPGFDFHTETHTQYLAFGEAKYSGSINPWSDALVQMAGFIGGGKDVSELHELGPLVSNSDIAIRCLNGEKAYIAAFSINSRNPDRIFRNVLESEQIKPLLVYPELYIVGIQICR